MSVHKLYDDRWIVQYRNPENNGKYKREYFGRGPDAERNARDRNKEIELRCYKKRTPRADKSPYFEDIANYYLSAKVSTIENTTYSVLMYKLRSIILPEFGHIEAMKITKERLDKYVEKRLAQGKKNGTIRRDIEDIQAIMNFAVERRLINNNPLAGYKKPSHNPEIVMPPTYAEMIEIDKHAPDHLRRALKIIFYTGARPGREITSLKWQNINYWEQNTIRIISARKHGLNYRDVPIFEDLRILLEKWMEADKKTAGADIKERYIISYKTKPVLSLKRSWRRANKLAGITRNIRPYSYRHAFVSTLLDSGADLKSVSEIVGHSNTDLTLKVYQHTNKLMHKNAIQKLPKMPW